MGKCHHFFEHLHRFSFLFIAAALHDADLRAHDNLQLEKGGSFPEEEK